MVPCGTVALSRPGDTISLLIRRSLSRRALIRHRAINSSPLRDAFFMKLITLSGRCFFAGAFRSPRAGHRINGDAGPWMEISMWENVLIGCEVRVISVAVGVNVCRLDKGWNISRFHRGNDAELFITLFYSRIALLNYCTYLIPFVAFIFKTSSSTFSISSSFFCIWYPPRVCRRGYPLVWSWGENQLETGGYPLR